MPYLRLYSPDVPVEDKRVVAKELIEITLRTLHLRPKERNQITVQFITLAWPDAGPSLEVFGHDLTELKKRAFVEEVGPALAHLLPMKPKSRIAQLLRIKAHPPRQVAIQFNELSPAISDPFVVIDDTKSRAA